MNSELLFGVALLLVIAVAVVFVLLSRYRSDYYQLQAKFERLQGEMKALGSASAKMGEQFSRVDERTMTLLIDLQKMDERIGRLNEKQVTTTQDKGGTNSSYEQAVKLARKGATEDELVELCGISRGEAGLVSMMHRYERTDNKKGAK